VYKTVFILGAGASADAGLPVMANFLDRARDYFTQGLADPREEEAFKKVFEAIHELKGITFKSSLDLNNIEAVFSAIDMGLLLGKIGDIPEGELEIIYGNIQKLIAVTIDLSTRVNVLEKPSKQLEGSYYNFVSIIKDFFLEKALTSRNSALYPLPTIITFNYDIALDYAFHLHGIPIDYCTTTSSGKRQIKLIKLHGSVNWGYSDKHDQVFYWELEDFLEKKGITRTESSPIRIGSLISFEKDANGDSLKGPFIVPPAWSKREYHQKIQPVWRAGARALSEAEAIYVIGYSLPETDVFFKYLFSLSTFSDASIRRFCVFDLNKSVEDQFIKLLGPGLGTNERFQFHKVDFEHARPILINDLKKHF